MISPVMARPIMNAKMPRVPRSSCSNSVPWPEWPWFISSLISRYPCFLTYVSLPVRPLQKSQRLRRVDGQQRTRSQVAEEVSHPEAANAGNDREVHPAHMKRGTQCRFNMPKDIDHTHQYDPGGDPNQSVRLALQLAREQQRERHRELEYREEQAHLSPSNIHAAHIPGNLFGQVAGPDDEPLREIEIRP